VQSFQCVRSPSDRTKIETWHPNGTPSLTNCYHLLTRNGGFGHALYPKFASASSIAAAAFASSLRNRCA